MARVLVVDDNDCVRKMLCEALEHCGHQVVDAANGVQAIAQFSEGAFDLVISDIVMPEKEGLETIIELRGIDPNVAILAISGGGSFAPDSYLESAIMLGADRSLSKPFTVNQLVEAVDELVGAAPATGTETA